MVKAINFKVKKNTWNLSPVDMDHGDFFNLLFVRPTQLFVPYNLQDCYPFKAQQESYNRTHAAAGSFHIKTQCHIKIPEVKTPIESHRQWINIHLTACAPMQLSHHNWNKSKLQHRYK